LSSCLTRRRPSFDCQTWLSTGQCQRSTTLQCESTKFWIDLMKCAHIMHHVLIIMYRVVGRAFDAVTSSTLATNWTRIRQLCVNHVQVRSVQQIAVRIAQRCRCIDAG
jgi:hypothetical protein